MASADFRMNLRFSEEDYNYIEKCYAKSNFRTKAKFFRHLVENTNVVQLPVFGAEDALNELISVRKQIEGIAKNVNQMARHLNETKKESVLGYNVRKMLEILPKVTDLQKECNNKAKAIQTAYAKYIEKIYSEE